MGRRKLCSDRLDFDRRCFGDGVDDPHRSRDLSQVTQVVLIVGGALDSTSASFSAGDSLIVRQTPSRRVVSVDEAGRRAMELLEMLAGGGIMFPYFPTRVIVKSPRS
jgi:hypothetical protein